VAGLTAVMNPRGMDWWDRRLPAIRGLVLSGGHGGCDNGQRSSAGHRLHLRSQVTSADLEGDTAIAVPAQ